MTHSIPDDYPLPQRSSSRHHEKILEDTHPYEIINYDRWFKKTCGKKSIHQDIILQAYLRNDAISYT